MLPKKLLTVPQVARVLNVTEDHVYTMARGGIIPVVRIGRHVRVDQKALEEWIDSGGRAHPGGSRREAVKAN